VNQVELHYTIILVGWAVGALVVWNALMWGRFFSSRVPQSFRRAPLAILAGLVYAVMYLISLFLVAFAIDFLFLPNLFAFMFIESFTYYSFTLCFSGTVSWSVYFFIRELTRENPAAAHDGGDFPSEQSQKFAGDGI
jgi:hypothetical protein